MAQDEFHNKILEYGSLARCFADYERKIQQEGDVDGTLTIAKGELKESLTTAILNDSALINFVHLVNFIRCFIKL